MGEEEGKDSVHLEVPTWSNTDEQSWNEIAQAKRLLFEEGKDPHDCEALRPEIADSWMRCHEAGLDPHERDLSRVVSNAEYKKVFQSYQPLIEIVDNYLNVFHDVGLENSYIFELLSNDSLSLLQRGNLDLHEFVKPESVFSEATMGTNAHSLCLRNKAPMQVLGIEHYCDALNGLVAHAAPIFNGSGVIIAVLLLTQPVIDELWSPQYQVMLDHALGLVTSIASTIEQRLQFQISYNTAMSLNERYKSTLRVTGRLQHTLDAAIDTSDEAIVLVNGKGLIEHVNPEAARMLGRAPGALEGSSAASFFKLSWPKDSVPAFPKNASKSELVQVGTMRYKLFQTPVTPPNSNQVERVLIHITRADEPSARARDVGDTASVSFGDILGESPKMQQAIARARRFAATAENILIMGESGTGKELFSQAIHNASRAQGPYMSINCASIPPRLIESELFGYESGAFTGAERGGKAGKIELANNGTLFLDEIGDMPLELQATLLRVLENKRVMRLGGKAYKQVDFRVVAATNRDLMEMVNEGLFREDLFYRLCVLTVDLPPLREREGDIELLARYYLEECKRKQPNRDVDFSAEALRAIRHNPWPGNVRQLKNAVITSFYVSDGEEIAFSDLPSRVMPVQGGSHSSVVEAADRGGASAHWAVASQENARDGEFSLMERIEQSPSPYRMEEFEQAAIKLALRHANNSVTKAAELLGMSQSTLYRRIKSLEGSS